MTKINNKLGKLGQAILDDFIEGKPGEKIAMELRWATYRQITITQAVRNTSDRLWKEWTDKRLWNAIFNHLPENKELLIELKESVKTFYGHPTDQKFTEVLTEILRKHHEFSENEIDSSVNRYIEVLTEELVQADEAFRENYRALADTRGEKVLKETGERLQIMVNVPPKSELIIGRDKDIKELKERLSNRSGDRESFQVLTAIKGWPGVGKTTTASALAHDPDIKSQFPDGVLWTSLGQDPNIISNMAVWGRALGTDEILKAKTVEDAKSMLAGLMRNKRMLLIVDDVWKAQDAAPFKVGGVGCATLITTRLDGVANELSPTANNIYRLKILNDEYALELLRQLAPSVVDAHPKECLELVQELEGLPLALQVAGRMLNTEVSHGFGVTELIAGLRDGSKLLEATSPADKVDLVTETTPTIAALLYKSLDRLDDATKDCYAYLGVFAPKPATFDANAMKYIWQVEDPQPFIRILVDRGLMEYLQEIDRYQMHVLLVMLAKSLLAEE